MSAIEIRRYKRNAQAGGFCCVPDCRTTQTGGWTAARRVAVAEVFLLGYSAGKVCKVHAKEWAEAYDEAAGISPDREMREALAA